MGSAGNEPSESPNTGEMDSILVTIVQRKIGYAVSSINYYFETYVLDLLCSEKMKQCNQRVVKEVENDLDLHVQIMSVVLLMLLSWCLKMYFASNKTKKALMENLRQVMLEQKRSKDLLHKLKMEKEKTKYLKLQVSEQERTSAERELEKDIQIQDLLKNVIDLKDKIEKILKACNSFYTWWRWNITKIEMHSVGNDCNNYDELHHLADGALEIEDHVDAFQEINLNTNIVKKPFLYVRKNFCPNLIFLPEFEELFKFYSLNKTNLHAGMVLTAPSLFQWLCQASLWEKDLDKAVYKKMFNEVARSKLVVNKLETLIIFLKVSYLLKIPFKDFMDKLLARALNLGNDLKGDYYQVGGTLVTAKGGEKVLLNHKQESLADHVDPKEVLKCLNIDVAASSEEKVQKNGAE